MIKIIGSFKNFINCVREVGYWILVKFIGMGINLKSYF